ncbi:hypothetical protein CDL12_25116 [Handroanthus impetiginosus]|uniref:Uncharacterized protein n=1 Tax=Handroanthus impetiginosus TaxID=429701 RepID=A0A2G9GAQ1_9LAMI|nr:hypothetical protein CDL12_25116 [Handroanthus impetiginosus]
MIPFTLQPASNGGRKMLLPAASALTLSNFPVASTKSRISQPHDSFLINVRKQHVSVPCSAKFPGMEYFNEPKKLIVFLNHTKDKVWESIPVSVKQFPWQKAESVALHKLLVLGKETLKWSLLAWFAFSWPSDIIRSISRNKELVIPFGLFVGSFMTKYLDEISQEFMHDDKGGGFARRLLVISCFFVFVKVNSTYLLQGNDFLLHAANGGLMQVLWNWKELQKPDEEKSLSEDASTPMNVDN